MIPDEVVVVGVIAMRFLVPLTMLRYPLPGMLATLAADAMDGAILSAFSDLTRENKQNYDKALDTYYLAIAYMAVLRNWSDPFALRIGRFLWYLRLTGVALFALTGSREVLFLFPASFEFFFIFYEAVRVRWSPERLARAHLVLAAVVVTFVFKLPQELFVHVARLSLNDLMKEHVFGVDPSATRLDAVAANPWAAVALLALLAAMLALGWRSIRWLPPAEHAPVFDANEYWRETTVRLGPMRRVPSSAVLNWALAEKLALITLTAIVFAEFVPGVHASVAQMTAGVAAFVVTNAVISSWIARHGNAWRLAALEFTTMSLANSGIVLGILLVTRWTDASIDALTALFYLLLFTLLITLYDRYRGPRRWQLVAVPQAPAPGTPAPPRVGVLR